MEHVLRGRTGGHLQVRRVGTTLEDTSCAIFLSADGRHRAESKKKRSHNTYQAAHTPTHSTHTLILHTRKRYGSDASGIADFVADVSALRPTVLLAPPRIWNGLYAMFLAEKKRLGDFFKLRRMELMRAKERLCCETTTPTSAAAATAPVRDRRQEGGGGDGGGKPQEVDDAAATAAAAAAFSEEVDALLHEPLLIAFCKRALGGQLRAINTGAYV